MPTSFELGQGFLGNGLELRKATIQLEDELIRVTPKECKCFAISSVAFQNADSPGEMSSCHPKPSRAVGRHVRSDDQP